MLTEHPAVAIIEEEIAERGWSLDRLAVEMGGQTPGERIIDRLALDVLLACRAERSIRIGDASAAKLALAFGVDAQFFLNLDRSWKNSSKEPQCC